MAELVFTDLSFQEKEDTIVITLLKLFEIVVDKAELERIAPITIQQNSITFAKISEKTAANKFNRILAFNIEKLKHKLTQRPSLYIHRYSGIPLIGVRYIGIADKGSNLLEVKPMTSCNIACTFCSVDEGPGSKKRMDYVIEEAYLAAEVKRLLDFKQCKDMHIYINPHGEPTLYPRLVELIADLTAISWVKHISIITNGSLLTERFIDELIAAGLTHLNLSLNAVTPEKAVELAGTKAYNVEKAMQRARYAAKSKKLKVILAPVWVHGVNDGEIGKIIRFAKEIGADVGIQKYSYNARGRNPVKEKTWEYFEQQLKQWEKQYGLSLLQKGKIEKTKELPKPMQKGETITATIVWEGRGAAEKLCMAKGRLIEVHEVPAGMSRKEIRVKLTEDTHNIFTGVYHGKR